MANSNFFHIFAVQKTFNMIILARLLFFMFVAFIMVLVFMVALKLINKASEKEDRDSFMKNLDELAERIKNK